MTNPPLEVRETGYGSFMLSITVHFRKKDVPEKVRYEYDLLLPNWNNPPINQSRCECFTFKKPSEDFQLKFFRLRNAICGDLSLSLTENRQVFPLSLPKPSNLSAPGVARDNIYTEEGKEIEKTNKKKKEKINQSSSISSNAYQCHDIKYGISKTQSKNDKTVSCNSWDADTLMKLCEQINSLTDPGNMRKVVDVIQETEFYRIRKSTFDFDLSNLNDTRLSKIVRLMKHTN